MNPDTETLANIYKVWGHIPAPLPLKNTPFDIPNVGRDDLPTLFKELGFKRGAEIGVERGAYSQVLCERNPGVELFCVDAWTAYKGYREHVTQEQLDDMYEFTRKRLAPFRCRLVRAFSVDAVELFEDNTLDFVYIDANHNLMNVIQDIYIWEKKVRPGGIVAGHDYCKRVENGYQVHVMEAVQAYTQAYHIAPWFVLGTKAMVPGQVRDKPRSWMYVRDNSVHL